MDHYNSDGEGEDWRYRKKNRLLEKNQHSITEQRNILPISKRELVTKKFNHVSRFSPLHVPGRKKRRVNEVGKIRIE